VEILIADEDGREMPPGETGEIWVRTAGVIKGYYKNPEQTAAEFQDGYWKSGDLGTIDEKGYVYIVDRKKDMIISGGFNIYPVEVEAALNGHPAVLMSAVVGIPGACGGRSEGRGPRGRIRFDRVLQREEGQVQGPQDGGLCKGTPADPGRKGPAPEGAREVLAG
jgi:acyl-CoA synthetase (AMP-forming)/AMP-acid ligase II